MEGIDHSPREWDTSHDVIRLLRERHMFTEAQLNEVRVAVLQAVRANPPPKTPERS